MTQYGPEIKRGSDAWPATDERPVWLSDDDRIDAWMSNNGRWVISVADRVDRYYPCDFRAWKAIRLPIDHWANAPLRAGFIPWSGGDSAPDDWDGGDVLYASGLINAAGDWWKHSNDMYQAGYEDGKESDL